MLAIVHYSLKWYFNIIYNRFNYYYYYRSFLYSTYVNILHILLKVILPKDNLVFPVKIVICFVPLHCISILLCFTLRPKILLSTLVKCSIYFLEHRVIIYSFHKLNHIYITILPYFKYTQLNIQHSIIKMHFRRDANGCNAVGRKTVWTQRRGTVFNI